MGIFDFLKRPKKAPRVRYGFKAASTGSLATSYARGDVSIRSVEQTDLPLVRARSRDLVRNSDVGKKALSSWTTAVVGSGVPCRSNTGDEAVDAEVDALFDDWAADADATGRLDLYGLQVEAFKTMFTGGEVLIRRVVQPGVVPLKLQVLPAEYLATEKDDEAARIKNGVEFDARGRVVAYWLHRTDPLETGGDTPVRVPESDVAHAFDFENARQTRGVPWLAPVIDRIYALDDYLEAERIRKRVEASLAVIVTSPDGSSPFGNDTEDTDSPLFGLRDATGDAVTGLSPGAILNAPPESDIHVVAPAQVWGFPDYVKTSIRSISVGLRMPYEMLAGDLSEVNYSSIRFGMLEFRGLASQVQRMIVGRMILRKVWTWFVQAAIASGNLPPGRYPVKFVFPVMEDVDRRAEAQADREEIRSGLSSLQDVLTRRGRDWREVLTEQAAAKKFAESLGLTLDSIETDVPKVGS